VILVVAVALLGCTAEWELKITEVGAGIVELHLNEAAGSQLVLADHAIQFLSTDNSGATANESGQLELIGSLGGGEFLVVFEVAGYTGAPVQQSFTTFTGSNVPGIAVAEGSFGAVDPARSYAYRLYGRRFRYIFPFFYTYDETDDVVTFGPRPRPSLGGTYAEDGSLDQVVRTRAQGLSRGQTLRRRAPTVNGVKTPVDRDLEADWRADDESWGQADGGLSLAPR
jgi:hypothetical protein